MKKIFIPFDSYTGGVGGPATFMSHLKNYLDDKGFNYCTSHRRLGVRGIFFPISYDIELLKKFKKKGITIIQRLDGVYYPSKHGDTYIALNKDMKEIHNNLADIVVYQSRYSKAACEKMFGRLTGIETHIILNGTDKKVFYPSQESRKELAKENEVRILMTGVFRHREMIEPIVRALDSVKSEFSFRLVTAGPVTNEDIRHYFERPYIVQRDGLNHAELAEELRRSDLFVYSILNPACPNSVIEAVSCGVPVVGFKSGAMEELLHFNKELLADVSDEVFQEYKDFDEHRLAEKILLAAREFRHFKQRALEHSHLYPFEDTGERYLDIFKKALECEDLGLFRRLTGGVN